MGMLGGSGRVSAIPPVYTDGTEDRLSLDTSGNLRIKGTFTTTPSGTQDVRVVDDLDVFARILQSYVKDTEELRKDSPVPPVANTFEYIGIAPSGSATSASIWNVVRISYAANGTQSRYQFRPNIVWDNRTTGWL